MVCPAGPCMVHGPSGAKSYCAHSCGYSSSCHAGLPSSSTAHDQLLLEKTRVKRSIVGYINIRIPISGERKAVLREDVAPPTYQLQTKWELGVTLRFGDSYSARKSENSITFLLKIQHKNNHVPNFSSTFQLHVL